MPGRQLLFASVLLGILIIGAIAFGLLTGVETGSLTVSIGDLEERELIHFEKEHIIVVFNDGDPLALTDDVQHLGDTVRYCESSGLLESNFHGSKFDIRGYYFGGPAPRGLGRHPVRRDDDQLVIDTTRLIEGPERGEGPPLQPVGDFC